MQRQMQTLHINIQHCYDTCVHEALHHFHWSMCEFASTLQACIERRAVDSSLYMLWQLCKGAGLLIQTANLLQVPEAVIIMMSSKRISAVVVTAAWQGIGV